MPFGVGARLGPYEVIGPLGVGGMGEVYRARDTRLDRHVAIKILAPSLAENPDARLRFEREARAISALSHPNICHLYDVGRQDGTVYLVMEYLDGETLADRLMRGLLPTDQVLKYGIDVSQGLENAHRNGVLHRDLKPGNIMLTKTGAKLMDFGLAKSARSSAAPSSDLTRTIARSEADQPVTGQGTIIGTFQYMSPEQVEGKETDARSDIFALGVVLYEMATARSAFDGKTTSAVMAAILERNPPPISAVHPASPPALDRIVKTCLAKDPEDRWRSAHDVKLQLENLRSELESAPRPATQQSGIREKIAWGLAALLLLALALIAATSFHKPQLSGQPVRSSLLPPANWSFLLNNASLSPDGSRLAFVGVGPNGETRLWIRSLATGAEQPLSGSDGATVPFWSPDSTRIGFFADSKLKVTDAGGGALPQTLAEATFGRGGTWNRDGTILFAPDIFGGLYRIPDTGGTATPVTKSSGQAHRWPYFLPDGKHFLFTIDWTGPGESPGNGIYVASLDGGALKPLLTGFASNAMFASGRLLYVRDLTLLAQRFDPDRAEFTGPAEPVLQQQVATNDSFAFSAFSVSQTGSLVFHSVADLPSQLVWFNSKGEQLGQVPATNPSEPRLSPDGRAVAFAADESGNGKRYLRLYDLARDVSTRLTDTGGEEGPSWSQDGRKLCYITRGVDTYFVDQIAADGSGAPQVLWKGRRLRHPDCSRPGLAVLSDFTLGRPRVAVLSTSDWEVKILHPGAEPRISPDGRWLVYTLSGGHPFHPEVFVEPFPGPGARIQISRAVGAQGTWSHDGKQIFFIAGDQKLMAVDFDGRNQKVSPPRALFQSRIIAPNFVGRQYDVASDGRFLINSLPQGAAPPVTLLTNWIAHKDR